MASCITLWKMISWRLKPRGRRRPSCCTPVCATWCVSVAPFRHFCVLQGPRGRRRQTCTRSAPLSARNDVFLWHCFVLLRMDWPHYYWAHFLLWSSPRSCISFSLLLSLSLSLWMDSPHYYQAYFLLLSSLRTW